MRAAGSRCAAVGSARRGLPVGSLASATRCFRRAERVTWARSATTSRRRAHRRAVERNFRVIDAAEEIAAAHGATVPQVAIAWMLGVEGVTAPIRWPADARAPGGPAGRRRGVAVGGRARAAGGAGAAARRRRRGRRAARRSSPARTCRGSPARSRPPRSPSSTCRSCSTARRAPGRSRSTCARSAAPPTPAAGQKWLCGADGTGMLYVAPGVPRARAGDRARATCPSQDAAAGSTPRCTTTPAATTRRRCRARRVAFSLAATACSRPPGSTPCTRAPPALAARLADALAERGPHGRAARRHDARRLGGPRPAGRRASGSPPPASSSATCRARRTCAPRSAPGTTRATSSGCSPRSSAAAC